MRVILILAVVVLLMALVGWIKFSNTPQQSTISIEKETIKQDTDRVVERGNEFLEDTRRATGTEAAPTTPTQPAPVEPAPSTNVAPVPPPVEREQPATAPPTSTVR
jgi:type IV secretory pathway VirB10-like protein